MVWLELVLVRQRKNKWLRCWSEHTVCCATPNQRVITANFIPELSLTNCQSTLNSITLIMKCITWKLLFGCAVKHLHEMDLFVAEKLLQSLRLFSSLHNFWVLENVRQPECIFMQRIYDFHFVYSLLVLAIDLFQLAEPFSELGEIGSQWMDLSFLCFDNSLKLGVFCFLIVEFLFELLDFSFKLVENDGLDTLELKSIKPN